MFCALKCVYESPNKWLKAILSHFVFSTATSQSGVEKRRGGGWVGCEGLLGHRGRQTDSLCLAGCVLWDGALHDRYKLSKSALKYFFPNTVPENCCVEEIIGQPATQGGNVASLRCKCAGACWRRGAAASVRPRPGSAVVVYKHLGFLNLIVCFRCKRLRGCKLSRLVGVSCWNDPRAEKAGYCDRELCLLKKTATGQHLTFKLILREMISV